MTAFDSHSRLDNAPAVAELGAINRQEAAGWPVGLKRRVSPQRLPSRQFQQFPEPLEPIPADGLITHNHERWSSQMLADRRQRCEVREYVDFGESHPILREEPSRHSADESARHRE